MKLNEVKRAYLALQSWSFGRAPIGRFEHLVGDSKHVISDMLRENDLLDGWDKVTPDLTPIELQLLVLVYLSMRAGIK